MNLSIEEFKASTRRAVIVGCSPENSCAVYFKPSDSDTVDHLKKAAVGVLQSHMAVTYGQHVELASADSVLAFDNSGPCSEFLFFLARLALT